MFGRFDLTVFAHEGTHCSTRAFTAAGLSDTASKSGQQYHILVEYLPPTNFIDTVRVQNVSDTVRVAGVVRYVTYRSHVRYVTYILVV